MLNDKLVRLGNVCQSIVLWESVRVGGSPEDEVEVTDYRVRVARRDVGAKSVDLFVLLLCVSYQRSTSGLVTVVLLPPPCDPL